MSTNETPVTTVTPEATVDTATPVEKTKEPVASVTPVTPSQKDILQNVYNLCNTTLYVLTKGFYPGSESHNVDTAKEFVKEIKNDVERKMKALSDNPNGQEVK